ncbi:gnat family [Moniliophthora roreri MCA 2997]|uniref:Gnat family n=2 Tax=Moniliophthora roreri TaxID=221103 RepID=V2XAA5_MONRO|nr:gnat family [Moniliophthora roreri MCA 2997]KAI3597495.1 gnat family [Moniliophthora roreri]
MSQYQVFPVPAPPSPAHIQSYKSLRLLSLQTNPESFSSKYENEAKFTNDQWRARVDPGPKGTKVTIVAADGAQGNWAGMITVLSPQYIDFTKYIPTELKRTRAVDSVYVIVGMWVHPEHRRRGLGKRLIEGAAAWIKERDPGSRTMLLEVLPVNKDAIALYGKAGFSKVQGAEVQTPGAIFMYSDLV